MIVLSCDVEMDSNMDPTNSYFFHKNCERTLFRSFKANIRKREEATPIPQLLFVFDKKISVNPI